MYGAYKERIAARAGQVQTRTNGTDSMAKVLIVFGHEDSKNSFNAAMKDVAVETLTQKGAEVKVSALHDMKFTIYSPEDIVGGPTKPDQFNWNYEAGIANKEGKTCDQIKQEQDKVSWADIIIYQFPLQSMAFPAIVSAWNARVLSPGFASAEGQMFENGPMKGKKVVLSFTCGSFEAMYTNRGLLCDIGIILYPMIRALEFFGFSFYKPQVSYGVMPGNQQVGAEHLANWRKRLETVLEEELIQVSLPLSSFDFTTFMVSEETQQKYAADECGPTIGQNMGKPLPTIC